MIFGKKVALGPIIPDDLALLYQWADDPESALMSEPYRPAAWAMQQEFWLNANAHPDRVFFAIRAQPDTTIIGFVQIIAIDPIHRSAKLGIKIGNADAQGKGYGREALMLAIDYCWQHLNLSRVALDVFAHNQRAIGLYETIGFVREGELRHARFIAGAWVDVVLMALMRPDRQREGDVTLAMTHEHATIGG